MRMLKILLLKFLDLLLKCLLVPLDITYIFFSTSARYIFARYGIATRGENEDNRAREAFYRKSLRVAIPAFLALLAVIGGICALFILSPSAFSYYAGEHIVGKIWFQFLAGFIFKRIVEQGLLSKVLKETRADRLDKSSKYALARMWIGAEKQPGWSQRIKAIFTIFLLVVVIVSVNFNPVVHAFLATLADSLKQAFSVDNIGLIAVLVCSPLVLMEVYIFLHTLLGEYPVDEQRDLYGDALYYEYEELEPGQIPLFGNGLRLRGAGPAAPLLAENQQQQLQPEPVLGAPLGPPPPMLLPAGASGISPPGPRPVSAKRPPLPSGLPGSVKKTAESPLLSAEETPEGPGGSGLLPSAQHTAFTGTPLRPRIPPRREIWRKLDVAGAAATVSPPLQFLGSPRKPLPGVGTELEAPGPLADVIVLGDGPGSDSDDSNDSLAAVM